MPSSQKTPKLALNKWSGTDIPKMADYNNDNQILDTTLGGHLGDAVLHLSGAERALWNAPFVIGTYAGNDAASRTVTLGFAPKFGVIYPVNGSVFEYDADAYIGLSLMGFLSTSGSSHGVTRQTTGFSVLQQNPPIARPTIANLNRAGVTYCYVMYK